MLDRARERNREYGVTGLLLYCEGNFMQYIEGGQDAITAIFGIILADALHRDVTTLVDEPVMRREFEGWSMAYAPAHEDELAQLTAAEWHPRPAGIGIEPHRAKGKKLLRQFWKRQMRSSL